MSKVEQEAMNVDALAQEIRRVDGDHTLGAAAALAEALMPFLRSAKNTAEPVAISAWRWASSDEWR